MLSIINALYYSGHEDNLQRFLSTDVSAGSAQPIWVGKKQPI